jgi:hypothetical protein
MDRHDEASSSFLKFFGTCLKIDTLPLRGHSYSTDTELRDFDITGSFKKRACYLTERNVIATWYLF